MGQPQHGDTQMEVLILLGNENTEDGTLKPIAKSRCKTAANILRSKPNIKVLPTGAFDPCFNASDKAHGKLLSEYLVQVLDINPERVLPHTNSTNTIEDALCARKTVLKLKVEKLNILTSEYHMPRVKYIFQNIFPDIEKKYIPDIEYEKELDEGEVARLKKDEARKLRRTMKEWIDVPLYKAEKSFPNKIYENASQEQRHYDTISIAVLTGIILSFIYPHSINFLPSQEYIRIEALFVSEILILLLLCIYVRVARTARTARRVLQYIELAYGKMGFSANYGRQSFVRSPMTVFALAVGMGLAFAVIQLGHIIFWSLYPVQPCAVSWT